MLAYEVMAPFGGREEDFAAFRRGEETFELVSSDRHSTRSDRPSGCPICLCRARRRRSSPTDLRSLSPPPERRSLCAPSLLHLTPPRSLRVTNLRHRKAHTPCYAVLPWQNKVREGETHDLLSLVLLCPRDGIMRLCMMLGRSAGGPQGFAAVSSATCHPLAVYSGLLPLVRSLETPTFVHPRLRFSMSVDPGLRLQIAVATDPRPPCDCI